MRLFTQCWNTRHNPGYPEQRLYQGHHKKCPECESLNIERYSVPENADDIKVLRADYNRRHMNEPGFVPSVEYDKNGNPVES